MAFVFTWFFKERTKKGKRLDWNAEADYYWSLICSGRCFEVLVTLSFLSLFLLRRPVEAVRSYVYSRTPLYNSCCCYYSSHIWLLVTHMHIPLYYIHIVVCKNWQGLKKGFGESKSQMLLLLQPLGPTWNRITTSLLLFHKKVQSWTDKATQNAWVCKDVFLKAVEVK